MGIGDRKFGVWGIWAFKIWGFRLKIGCSGPKMGIGVQKIGDLRPEIEVWGSKMGIKKLGFQTKNVGFGTKKMGI